MNTKITIKMLHLLWFSSYHLLPVLCHKSKVAYSSSEIGPSSPADWTSNLENHASRYSNNQQAFMGSTSVCICPPLLQYPCGNVHHYGLHFCLHLPSITAISLWKRSPCSSLTEPILWKEVRMRTQEVDFHRYIAPQGF